MCIAWVQHGKIGKQFTKEGAVGMPLHPTDGLRHSECESYFLLTGKSCGVLSRHSVTDEVSTHGHCKLSLMLE